MVIVARYYIADPELEIQSVNLQWHRHGARLDAADSQWHLTSPTPYDPPLTYGGWKQSQALGARIGSIIKFREDTSEEIYINGNGEGEQRLPHHPHRERRRKHNVIIHTSPFLRCVQSSIAISAGMEQYRGSFEVDHLRQPRPHVLHSGSPRIRAMDHQNSSHLSAIPEPEVNISSRQNAEMKGQNKTAQNLLRVDAFLGEWLSPDYFDNITPPPGSKMMVAGAKADLLRRGDPVDGVLSNANGSSHQGHFPGGWKSNDARGGYRSDDSVDNSPLSGLSDISQNLPKLVRANSHSTVSPGKWSSRHSASRLESAQSSENTGYVPPKPSYAISPSQPIPQGYVAHARDACVKVDYQWDSLRPPLEWGSGGEYGEEWSSMHKRFRRGLNEMLSWYNHHDPLCEPRGTINSPPGSPLSPNHFSEEPSSDNETDTILVLVTHGAGCNALIGALTNQPVLIDVGMASLTMAVRKTIDYQRFPTSDAASSSTHRRRSSMDPGASEDYDVKLVASTDHLRPGSQFLSPAPPQRHRSPSLPVREESPYRYERHNITTSHHNTHRPLKEAFEPESPTTYQTHAFQRSATASAGLWTKPAPPKASVEGSGDTKPPMVRGGDGVPMSKEPVITPKSVHSVLEQDNPTKLPTNGSEGRTLTQHGLWGAPPHALATERDKGAKRRWTLSQAEVAS